MYLSKEATEKDRQMKMQMLMTIDNNDSSAPEKIWLTNGFIGDQRSDLMMKIFLKIHFFIQTKE